MAIEVAKPPAVMRRKLLRPDAAAIWSERRPPSASAVSGMKKHDTAAPWSTVGQTSVMMSTSEVNPERIQATIAKITSEVVASSRVSMRLPKRPTSGVRMIASTPTGASTRPASVAV